MNTFKVGDWVKIKAMPRLTWEITGYEGAGYYYLERDVPSNTTWHWTQLEYVGTFIPSPNYNPFEEFYNESI